MSDLQALEARLREEPDDWGSWLVYADWLSDRGDARGEIIALSYRLAQTGPAALRGPERSAVTDRIQEITRQNDPVWRKGLVSTKRTKFEWRFGFLSEVSMPIRTASARKKLARLLTHPSARLLRALDASQQDIYPSDLEPLLGEGLLAPFSEIRLAWNRLGSKGAQILAKQSLPLLRGLDLWGNNLGDMGAAALASGGVLSPIRALNLRNNGIGPAGAVALAGARMPALERLALYDNPIDADGVEALVSSRTLVALRDIQIGFNDVSAEGWRHLVAFRAAKSAERPVF